VIRRPVPSGSDPFDREQTRARARRKEGRRLRGLLLREWRSYGDRLVREVMGIEDPLLRLAVGGVIDTVSSGQGAIVLEPVYVEPVPDDPAERVLRGFRIVEVELDEEASDLLDARFVCVNEALVWIVEALTNYGTACVGYLFGSLRIRGFEADETGDVIILSGIAAWNATQRRLSGVVLPDGSVVTFDAAEVGGDGR
jgi:hypothetical protein